MVQIDSWWDIEDEYCDEDEESHDNYASTLSTIWMIALAEPTPAGEALATAATIVIGGYMLWEFLEDCFDEYDEYEGVGEGSFDIDQCIALYVSCTTFTPYNPCDDCLHFCRSNGSWNYNICPN